MSILFAFGLIILSVFLCAVLISIWFAKKSARVAQRALDNYYRAKPLPKSVYAAAGAALVANVPGSNKRGRDRRVSSSDSGSSVIAAACASFSSTSTSSSDSGGGFGGGDSGGGGSHSSCGSSSSCGGSSGCGGGGGD